jgi:hypothetical protein
MWFIDCVRSRPGEFCDSILGNRAIYVAAAGMDHFDFPTYFSIGGNTLRGLSPKRDLTVFIQIQNSPGIHTCGAANWFLGLPANEPRLGKVRTQNTRVIVSIVSLDFLASVTERVRFVKVCLGNWLPATLPPSSFARDDRFGNRAKRNSNSRQTAE